MAEDIEEQEISQDVGNAMAEVGLDAGPQSPVESNGEQESNDEQADSNSEAATPAQDGNEPTQQGEDAAANTVDAVLRRAGHRYGLTDEDIEKMGDSAPQVLEKIKGGQDEISKRLGELGRQAMEGAQPQQNQQQSASTESQQENGQEVMGIQLPTDQQSPQANDVQSQPQKTGEAPVTGQQEQSDADSLLNQIPEMDEDFYGEVPKAVDILKKELASVKNQLQERTSKIDQLYQVQQQQAIQEAVSKADQHLNSLGGPFEEVYGSGNLTQMDPNSEAAKNRRALYNKAGQIKMGADRDPNSEPLSVQEAVDAALSIVTPELKESAMQQNVASQYEKESSQAISMPTSRGEGPDTEEDAEKEAAREAQKQANKYGLRW